MTEIRKKIIALSITATMLTGVSGCKLNKLKMEIDSETNQEKLYGFINNDAIKNCYFIELVGLDGNTSLYVGYANTNWDSFAGDKDFNLLGTNIEIAHTRDALNIYNSEYGTVKGIYPFSYFVSTYGEIKQEYTAEEITNIIDKIKENYNNIKDNDLLKKLELKKQ